MTKSFCAWYEKYIITSNLKYKGYVEELSYKIEGNKAQFQKLIELRERYTNLSQESNLDEKISSNSGTLMDLEQSLERVKSIKHEMDGRLLKDSAEKVYDKIFKHEKIKRVSITGDTLCIYTKKLKVKGHNIGNYKLTYRLGDDLYGGLSIENLEYVVNGGYDHWHVKLQDPCLSEWRPILCRQLDTFQLFFFVDTIIHYLLISSSAHAYISFEDWIKEFKNKQNNNQESGTEIHPIQVEEEIAPRLTAVMGWGSTDSSTCAVNSWSTW